MKYIGPHVSASGGVEFAPVNAKEVGATAFALFTRNQRQWVSKPLADASIALFKERCAEYGYDARYILPHDSYLINLGHPQAEGLEKSRAAFYDEMHRCEQLGLTMLNFHPGSHLNEMPADACLARIAESINIALDKTQGVTAVIENTAGQGSNVGFSFYHLAQIIDQIEDKSRVGVCLDTCHVFDGGYDIVNDLDGVLEEFDKIIGLDRLYAIHMNDSLNVLGSHKDRHACIGAGNIGLEAMTKIINHPALRNLPFYLETPNELPGYANEIALLRSKYL